MKKIISLLLALMLICAFCTPAFAAGNEPEEYVPHKNIDIQKGNYIISGREYTVEDFNIERFGTLTIGREVKITVTGDFKNEGTIIIYGSLEISKTATCHDNEGLIREVKCCDGEFSSAYTLAGKPVISDPHFFKDGVCICCGYKCPNIFHEGIYICPECRMVAKTTATGSVLSGGYPEIVWAVASAAIFGVGGFLLGRKKKPVPSDSTSAEDEE